MYVMCDETGRIGACTDVEEYAEGMVEFDLPADLDLGTINEYRIVDGELVHDPLPPTDEELAAEEEKERARQLNAAVPMLLSAVAESMDDDELASVTLALPEWKPGVKRKKGAACQHEGVAYRVVANVSQNNDAEPGTPEGADYYAPVDVGPSGVQAWEPDEYYMKGERVEHGGRVWESLKNNNREEPGTGNRWAEVANGAD